MIRPYLFMSGEASVTAPLVYAKNRWDYIGQPTVLVKSELARNCIRRKNRPNEIITGCIHYCDVSDKSIEINNLQIIIETKVKCWPDPKILLRMVNRHEVYKECIEQGFVTNKMLQDIKEHSELNFPFVLKIGTEHRGIGKYLIESIKDIPEFEGSCTVEPYYEGDSVRVLIIGEQIFGIQTINDQNWVKNAPGGEIIKKELSEDIIQHAKQVTNYFGLDIAGVDYIVNEDGFHFLEINQYPGVAGFDDIEECAKEFFKEKMQFVESI